MVSLNRSQIHSTLFGSLSLIVSLSLVNGFFIPSKSARPSQNQTSDSDSTANAYASAVGIQKLPILKLMARVIKTAGADMEGVKELCHLHKTMSAYMDAIETTMQYFGGRQDACYIPMERTKGFL